MMQPPLYMATPPPIISSSRGKGVDCLRKGCFLRRQGEWRLVECNSRRYNLYIDIGYYFYIVFNISYEILYYTCTCNIYDRYTILNVAIIPREQGIPCSFIHGSSHLLSGHHNGLAMHQKALHLIPQSFLLETKVSIIMGWF